MHYQGLKVEDISRLRNELRDVGAEFQVVKNRLLKLACQGTETALIEDQMKGPSAIALTFDDVVGPAKILVDFAKDFKQLEIKSGQISGKVIDADAIKRLANYRAETSFWPRLFPPCRRFRQVVSECWMVLLDSY